MTMSWPRFADCADLQQLADTLAGSAPSRSPNHVRNDALRRALAGAIQAQVEERLSAILEVTDEVFCALDCDWRLISLNGPAENHFGCRREAVLGQVLWDAFPLLNGNDLRLRCEQAMRTGEQPPVELHVAGLRGRLVKLRLFRYGDGLGITLRETSDRDEADAEILRASEDRLRRAVDAAELGIWDWDIASGRLICSERAKEIHGLPADGPVSHRMIRASIHPDDLPRISSQFRRALDPAIRDKAPYEYRVFRKDGSISWVLVQGEALFDARDGGRRALRHVGTIQDITTRKRAEEALRESEARLTALADNMPLGMVFQMTMTHSRAGRRFVYVSQNCLRVNGITPEMALENPAFLDNLILLEHWPDLAKAEAEALRDLKPMDVEVRMRHAMTGDVRWFQIISVPRILANGWLVWDGIQNDITERKRAAEALRQSEERLRTILNEMPVGVTLARVPDGQLLFHNAKTTELLGPMTGPSENGGIKSQQGAVHPDGAPYQPHEYPIAHTILTGEDIDQKEMLFRRSDGRIVHLAVSSTLVRESGETALAVSAFYDVTERKRAEEHQRMLINELNHRVKNTLATVQSLAAQSFRKTGSGGGEDAAARSAFEARLFALARGHDVLTRENWEGASLDEIVSEAFAPYRGHSETRDPLEVDGPFLRIAPAMALSLSMALHELCTNALKYGALRVPGGRIRISWKTAATEAGNRLVLKWEERDGPPVTPPVSRGFGSRLIENGLARELNGIVNLAYEPTGVICTLDVPLS